VHSADQRPNLRHLCEPLGGAKGLIKAVKEDDGKYVMKNKRECQHGVSSILRGQQRWNHGKQRCVEWTRGTDNRLVLEERRERGH